MKNLPDKIYLQVDPEEENELGMAAIERHEGITWCADKIFKTDAEYIHRAVYDERLAYIRALERKLEVLSQGWIPVEDDLPEEDCRVDAWMPEYNDGYKRVTSVNYNADREEFYIDYDLTDMTKYVTHWMPLPEAPENVKSRQ